MGLIVEMTGAPGSGKSTMIAGIRDACRDHGLNPYTVVEAGRELASRTVPGRLAARVPVRWRSGAVWAVFRGLSGWHTVRFALSHLRLTRYVIGSQRARPAEADVGRRRVLYWYARMMGSYGFLVANAEPHDVVILDEGFAHRAVQLHASSVESPSASQISAYIGLLPRPDLVVHVDASVADCQRRVHERGVWERLADRPEHTVRQLVANAHATATATAQELQSRGWPLLEIDNSSGSEDESRAFVRAGVVQALSSRDTTGVG